MDQVSGFPTSILHDILSRLSNKDRVTTMLLSKAWKETWSTFPVLCFWWSDQYSWRQRKIFLNYVTKTLLRFFDQGLAIKEFKVGILRYDECMLRDIDRWMKLAIESGVEVLALCLFQGYLDNKHEWYTFPAGVLEAKSLSKLKLMREVRFDQVVLNHSIKNFSLRVLHLRSVHFGDEGIIEHLISRSPLIEQITLDRCFVYEPPSTGCLLMVRRDLKSLSMNGLKKLKEVKVGGIQEVSIDAPSLESLSYSPYTLAYKLNFDSCKNLRELILSYCRKNVNGDEWLLELLSKFPFLETLKFKCCSMFGRINISSAQLKVLELFDCENLKEVRINAPNLLSCVYHCGYGSNVPIIYFLRSSSKLEINVDIIMGFLNLYNLREIIQNFKPHKVLASLSLSIHGQPHVVELTADVLQVSSPPQSVKHLNLKLFPTNKDLYSTLVNLLLSGCCPETISFSLGRSYERREAFAEFLLETLSSRNRDQCYCSSGHTKCWWHDLKNVKVTRSMERINSKTELDELKALPPEEIFNFRLEL